MYKDYEYWYKENKNLLEHLEHHNSMIYDRYSDIFTVLNYVKDLDPKYIDNDLEIIFDEGFAYIYDRISFLKTYIHDNFIGDIHAFLKYEELISYYLFLEDIMDVYEREEMDLDTIKEPFSNMQDKIMNIVNSRKEYDQDVIDEFEQMVNALIPSGKDIITVPEIFTRVYEEIVIKKGQEGIE